MLGQVWRNWNKDIIYNSVRKDEAEIDLTKDMRDSWTVDHKTPPGEVKERLGGTYYARLLAGSIVLRCQFSPDWSIGSMQVQSKLKAAFLVDWQTDSEIHVEMQRT